MMRKDDQIPIGGNGIEQTDVLDFDTHLMHLSATNMAYLLWRGDIESEIRICFQQFNLVTYKKNGQGVLGNK
jgi:hypothetical protein